jgi:hypothetical protein
MGYQPTKKTFNLLFEGDEFDGLQVRTGSPSIGALRKILSLSESDASDTAALDPMIRMFAELLVDWNVEDDSGDPVPATEDGLNSQDSEFVMNLIKAWGQQMRRNTQVPAPLDETSTGGSLSGVPSLPMDPSSRSQAS